MALVSPLRIAVIAPLAWRTPPVAYGPWELFASLLTEGLVAAGHDVTLFATGNSLTNARLSSVTGHGWEEGTVEPKVVECLHISSVFERAHDFDVIHNSFDFLPLTYSRLADTPVVTTVHGFSSDAVVDVYAAYNDIGAYVAISDSNRHPRLNYAATIGHGIATRRVEDRNDSGEHLMYFARIHPDKGTADAIDIARQANRPLHIAGIVHDQDYFDAQVAPHINDSDVIFLGAVPASQRESTLAGAAALLHPIAFDEPFGFSVAEALCVGTPVIAYDRGSMRELIRHGTDGFIVDSPATAARAVQWCDNLDRQEIGNAARRRFSVDQMVARYVEVYRNVLAS